MRHSAAIPATEDTPASLAGVATCSEEEAAVWAGVLVYFGEDCASAYPPVAEVVLAVGHNDSTQRRRRAGGTALARSRSGSCNRGHSSGGRVKVGSKCTETWTPVGVACSPDLRSW